MLLTDHSPRSTRAPAKVAPEGLERSKGFSVESSIGPLGTVEEVRYSGQPRRPHVLVVRVDGPEGKKIVLVPVSSIEEVIPDTGQIRLRPGILLRRSRAQTPRRTSQVRRDLAPV